MRLLRWARLVAYSVGTLVLCVLAFYEFTPMFHQSRCERGGYEGVCTGPANGGAYAAAAVFVVLVSASATYEAWLRRRERGGREHLDQP